MKWQQFLGKPYSYVAEFQKPYSLGHTDSKQCWIDLSKCSIKYGDIYAGTHDMLGGQIWGWYDKQGNTSQKNNIQQFLSDRTTEIAIPISAPFAVSDLISSDMMEVLFKLGGN